MTTGHPASAHFLLFLACLAWGGSYAVGRYGLNEGSALWLTLWRWGPGALLFSVYLAFTWPRVSHVMRGHVTSLSLISVLGIVIYPATLFLAVANTTALNASLYLAAAPVLIVLLSRLFWKEHLTRGRVAAIALGLTGAMVLVFRGDFDALASFQVATSDLWAVVSAVSWAGYCVALPLRPKALGELPFLAIITVIGSIILLIVALASGEAVPLPQTAGTAWSMAYFAVFPSVLAFFAWNWGTSAVGPAAAAPYNNLVPVCGGVLGILFLGEAIEGYHLLGGSLILGGLVLNGLRS